MNFSRRFSIQPMGSKVRVLLNRWYKVGDCVVLGTTGTESGIVLGFGKKHVPRGGFDHKKAGTYIDFARVQIAPSGGAPERYDSMEPIDFDDPDMAGVCAGVSAILIKVGDLPQSSFWEGDVVAVAHKDAAPVPWVVENIDYSRGDSAPYTLRHNDGVMLGRTMTSYSNSLKLVARGNLWKMEHDEPMEFANIEEEAKFYQSLGMSVKLSHTLPQSNMGFGITGRSTEEWEWKDAVTEIRRGAADEMKLKNKKDMTFVLIKYDRMEFGNRMRAHTLAKLGFIELGEDEN